MCHLIYVKVWCLSQRDWVINRKYTHKKAICLHTPELWLTFFSTSVVRFEGGGGLSQTDLSSCTCYFKNTLHSVKNWDLLLGWGWGGGGQELCGRVEKEFFWELHIINSCWTYMSKNISVAVCWFLVILFISQNKYRKTVIFCINACTFFKGRVNFYISELSPFTIR